LHRLGPPADVGGDELAVLVGQIQQDRTGLKDRDWFAAADRIVIDDRRFPPSVFNVLY